MVTATAQDQRTILFVDDERDMLTLVQSALDHYGYYVLGAISGETGLEIFYARHEVIDAVILDVQLPDIQGGELLRRMREVNETVPIIVTSGYDRGRIAHILDTGATDFLPKPFDFTKLSRKLEENIAPVPV